MTEILQSSRDRFFPWVFPWLVVELLRVTNAMN